VPATDRQAVEWALDEGGRGQPGAWLAATLPLGVRGCPPELGPSSRGVDAGNGAVSSLAGETTPLVGEAGRLLERAEVEVFEDLPDRQRVGDVGHHLERSCAASADERIRLEDLGHRHNRDAVPPREVGRGEGGLTTPSA